MYAQLNQNANILLFFLRITFNAFVEMSVSEPRFCDKIIDFSFLKLYVLRLCVSIVILILRMLPLSGINLVGKPLSTRLLAFSSTLSSPSTPKIPVSQRVPDRSVGPKGIIPKTGTPFTETESAGEYALARVDDVLNFTQRGSLWPLTFGLACCAVESNFLGGFKIIRPLL